MAYAHLHVCKEGRPNERCKRHVNHLVLRLYPRKIDGLSYRPINYANRVNRYEFTADLGVSRMRKKPHRLLIIGWVRWQANVYSLLFWPPLRSCPRIYSSNIKTARWRRDQMQIVLREVKFIPQTIAHKNCFALYTCESLCKRWSNVRTWPPA